MVPIHSSKQSLENLPTKEVNSPLQHCGFASSASCDWGQAADAQAVPSLCEGLLILHGVHPPRVPAMLMILGLGLWV